MKTRLAMKTLHRFLLPTFALFVAFAATPAFSQDEGSEDAATENPQVVLETSKGTIVLELYPDKAPVTVENFLAYVKAGFYDGTVFHRIVPNFVIQGGGFDKDMRKKETRPPIENESKNGLSNVKYTISMARTNNPHSATSQFFISTKDNPSLDPGGYGPWGYAVFGKAIEGQDVVDALGSVPVRGETPIEPVVLEKASVR